MGVLWGSRAALSVREVSARLKSRPPLAYTTVMTTMDRLFKKGLLARERAKDGSAFLYTAAMSRDDVHRRIVEETLSELLVKSADPVLAAFVDTAASLDRDHLARLEQLIAERRRGGGER